MTQQFALSLGLPLVMNPDGWFWCCGDCIPITDGRRSLSWMPPDYCSGRCVHCGRVYTFSSKYGEAELIEAGGRAKFK